MTKCHLQVTNQAAKASQAPSVAPLASQAVLHCVPWQPMCEQRQQILLGISNSIEAIANC